jgi:uncharacterized protein
MLLEFSVSNYLSFRDKTTFSMIANSSSGLEDNLVEVQDKRILKSASIYGANASGKSNLFKILSYVVMMLKNSNSTDINAKLPIIPFKLDDKYINDASEFEIKLIIDKIRYVYGFKADMNKIYEEYLYYYPNGRETKIFDRINIDSYSYSKKDEKILKEIERKNAPNKFFLATATNWNYAKTKPVYDFITDSIIVCTNLEDLKSISFDMFEENDKLKDFTINFLKKADFNIEDYVISSSFIPQDLFIGVSDFITKNISGIPKTYQILFKHKNSNNYLSLSEESLGTQILFTFIPFIENTLSNKKVLIIDELDKSMHPFLVQYIVSLFNDTDTNKNSSQLIFDTHDTNLLDLNVLRRDQIWFVLKDNDNGVSELYPLSDFSVRKKENVEKGYMLGRYGGVPFIKNDYNLWEEN